jgi:NAD(P)-dependent dehydrogenase (short-subunit alcohol dehydrogenase family)
VRKEEHVSSVFSAVERDLGSIAVLVCAAGGTVNTKAYRPAIVDTPLSDWIETEILNSRSVFLCVREYLRCRRARPIGDGRIVLISSLAAQVPGSPTGAAYAAAKSAVIGFMRGAALEAGPMGITVNVICPGAIDTPGFRATAREDSLTRIPASTPLRRLGEPADIAAAIVFLASPQASFMTGCTIDVNGGRRMA